MPDKTILVIDTNELHEVLDLLEIELGINKSKIVIDEDELLRLNNYKFGVNYFDSRNIVEIKEAKENCLFRLKVEKDRRIRLLKLSRILGGNYDR